MVIFDVVFQNTLKWAISAEDPIAFPLDCLPGWSMLNPALYPRIVETDGPQIGGSTAKATFIDEGSFYFLSNVFFLVLDESCPRPAWGPEAGIDWETKLSALAIRLRSESKQASVSPELKNFGLRDVASLMSLELPNVGEPCSTQSWHLHTAIRAEHILRWPQAAIDISRLL